MSALAPSRRASSVRAAATHGAGASGGDTWTGHRGSAPAVRAIRTTAPATSAATHGVPAGRSTTGRAITVPVARPRAGPSNDLRRAIRAAPIAIFEGIEATGRLPRRDD